MSGTPTLPTPDVDDFNPEAVDDASVQDVDFDEPADLVLPDPTAHPPATVIGRIDPVPVSLTQIGVPMAGPLEVRAVTFAEQLAAHRVVDDASFMACDSLFTTAASMLDEIDATFDPSIAAAHKAHKEALALKAKYYTPLKDALDAAKRVFLTAKGERDAAAERERLAVEARLRVEVEETAVEIAEELSIQGKHDEAEAVMEQARNTDVSAIAPASTVVNRTANVSTSGTWKVVESEIELLTLVKAIAAGKAPLACVVADVKYLNKRASADKAALKIPGVTARFVPNVRVRR